MFDPEATIQDADILMAGYAREAAALDAARGAGECVHGSWVGYAVNPATGDVFYPEQRGLSGTQVRCTDGCGRVFADDEDIISATQALL